MRAKLPESTILRDAAITPPSSVSGRAAASFSLRAKSRLRRLRFDTRLRAQPRGGSLRQHRIIPALRLKHRSGGSPRQEPPQAAVALRSASLRLGVRHGICVAKMLDKTSSIICAFGLAAAAPRSPYRHLELCGIALRQFPLPARPKIIRHLKRQHNAPAEGTGKGDAGQAHPRGQHRSSGSAQPRL